MEFIFEFVWEMFGGLFVAGGYWFVFVGGLGLLVYLYEKWKSPSKKELERQRKEKEESEKWWQQYEKEREEEKKPLQRWLCT